MLKNYAYLFATYPNNSPDNRLYRKCKREFALGTYSADMAAEIQRRTIKEGQVPASTLRPDIFVRTEVEEALFAELRVQVDNNIDDHPGLHKLQVAMENYFKVQEPDFWATTFGGSADVQ